MHVLKSACFYRYLKMCVYEMIFAIYKIYKIIFAIYKINKMIFAIYKINKMIFAMSELRLHFTFSHFITFSQTQGWGVCQLLCC